MAPRPADPDAPRRRDDFLIPENSVEAGDVDAEAAVSRFDEDKLRAYTVADGRVGADDIRGTGIVGRVEPNGSFVNTEVWVSVTSGLPTDTVLLACERLVGYLRDLNISPTSALIADDRERSPDQRFTEVFAVVQRDGTCEPTDLQVDREGPPTEPTTSTSTTTTTTGPAPTDPPTTTANPIPDPVETTTEPPAPTSTVPAPTTTDPPAPTTTGPPTPTTTDSPAPTTTGPSAPTTEPLPPTTTEALAPTTTDPPTATDPPAPTSTAPQTTSSGPPPSADSSTPTNASADVAAPP